MEDLVISAIYAGLVTGTLDPYYQLVSVSSISPLRDLPPNSIPTMINTLSEWSARCVDTLADLEKQIAAIKADALKRHKDEKEWNAHLEKLVEVKEKEAKEEGGKSGGGSGIFSGLGRRLGGGKRGGPYEGEDEEDMDLDYDDDDQMGGGQRNTRASKKRGFPGFGNAK